ncbi:hypothetical protein [Luteibacter sp. 329MFSha]|uniref:hypothetical protein n=1 Tax=Luteibacter sp. 329MFSha TaxID=1798239 RepID=UPI0011133956|nr:hypothetical protein [Luteibacter sp. 329MFSha]
MDDASMTHPATLMASLLATTLVACATPAHQVAPRNTVTPAHSSSQDHVMPPSDDAHALPGARDAAARVLAFLSTVSSTASFTPASIGNAMRVSLGPDPNNDPGWAIYHSPDLGQGWSYWVQFAAGEATLKPGFRFWFDHPDRSADAAPVCALPLEQLRSTLTAHGWAERSVPSEIGGVQAIEFAKADMVLTLSARDGAEVHGAACVLSLQTADAR